MKYIWIPIVALTFILFLLILFMTLTGPYNGVAGYPVSKTKIKSISVKTENKIKRKYNNSGLPGVLDYNIFKRAMMGYYNTKLKKNNVLSIVDFSQTSTSQRFYLIDLEKEKLLYQTYVAHGQKSGKNRARTFSNKKGSNQSSLGFYVTQETYNGKHGYSLRLRGIETGINHNARKRDIVMHGAEYVSDKFIDQKGYLGRSWGCPALPMELSTPIIQAIKNGSLLYIHANSREYDRASRYVPAVGASPG